MASHNKKIQAARHGGMQRIEHTEEVNDNMLPDAAEIIKLSEVDPNIIHWLKERAEKEQDYRHAGYDRRINLVDKHNKRDHDTGRIALSIYFLLVMGSMAISFVLLRDNHNVAGSIFGGTGLILALAVLLSRKPPKPPKED